MMSDKAVDTSDLPWVSKYCNAYCSHIYDI